MNIIKTNRRALQSGTTLIELSVVIAVILLLVGVLFIGVQAWRDGANKAACLVNISSVQKAVRGFENINLKTRVRVFTSPCNRHAPRVAPTLWWERFLRRAMPH
jgi:type II secretory pathway pseudopilin PulG